MNCPNCGCELPSEMFAQQAPRKASVAKPVAIVLLVAAAILAAVWFVGEKKKTDFQQAVSAVYIEMVDGITDAENALTFSLQVWKNAIYEERNDSTDAYVYPDGQYAGDFDTALANLFSDETYAETIAAISENQTSVVSLMREVSDVPVGYDEAYAAVKAMYENYIKLTTLATSLNGSYTSVSEDFAALEDALLENITALSIHLK